MIDMRSHSRPRALLFAVALLAALTTLGALACRPKTGPDRFLGTYRWRLLFVQQVVTLARNGKATYVVVTPGARENERATHDSLPGTYRIVGDTAFVAIDWREPLDSGKALAMVLRGDTLVLLNDLFGEPMAFVRD
jgi:hypothetical protein